MSPASRPFACTYFAHGSKSFAIRATLAASLARGASRVEWDGRARDVHVVTVACQDLGVRMEHRDGEWLEIEGGDGRFPSGGAIDLEDCGTGVRLMTAAAAFAPGPVTIDGSARLRERPLGPVVEAIRSLGATVRGDGLPLIIEGGDLRRDASIAIPGDISSQFVSALLLIGPLLGLEVRIAGEAVSRPYIELTVRVMEAFGARIERPDPGTFRVARTGYAATEYEVEGDASSAAFALAMAAVTGGDVLVANVPADTIQPDRAMVDHLAALGCETSASDEGLRCRGKPTRGAEIDLRDSPDLMPVLTAVAATIEDRTVIRGAPHLVHKESDRIGAMVDAVTALGGKAERRPDGIVVEGGGLRAGTVDPRGDHRIAMSAGILGLVTPGVTVLDPGCVAKSYQGFFEYLRLWA